MRRPANFVKSLEELQPDSLFQSPKKDDTAETAIMTAALAEFPGGWCFAREASTARRS